jgi:hypothetical protein
LTKQKNVLYFRQNNKKGIDMEPKELILNGKKMSVRDINTLVGYLSHKDDQGMNNGDSTNPRRGVCLFPKRGYNSIATAKMITEFLDEYGIKSNIVKSSLFGSCIVHINIESPEQSTQYYSLVNRIKSTISHLHDTKKK